MSLVPLHLLGYSNEGHVFTVWTNPAPCSYRWCRPFRLYYEKELGSFVEEVMSDVRREIKELRTGNVNGLDG